MKNPRKLNSIIWSAFFFINFVAQSQSPLDKLDLYYNQQHYKKVYRHSGQMLDKPEYDQDWEPAFFRALSILHLSKNRNWLKKHPHSLEQARQLWTKLDSTGVITDELTKNYAIPTNLFEDFTNRDAVKPDKSIELEKNTSELSLNGQKRVEIVQFASQQLEVPYKYGGNTPDGFDCSGFVSYIFEFYNISVPRSASEQYEKAQKVSEKKLQPGDLVFFDSGNGVNHVGIIVSKNGEPLKMIHSSTTKGIILTDIETSDYWKQRMKGFGSFLQN